MVPRSPIPSENRFDNLFTAAGLLWDVPAAILKAMAAQESGFNPEAIGASGERGMMQLLPSTARGLGWSGDLAQLLDATTSVQLAARVLRQNFKRFGNWRDAVAAYNVGWDPAAIAGTAADRYVAGVEAHAARWGVSLPTAAAAAAAGAAVWLLVPVLILLRQRQ